MAWFLIIACVSVSAVAQTALTGGLSGKVTDPSRGRIPGVTVSLKSESLSVTRAGTTDAGGAFLFLNLIPAADYQLSVSKEGFATVSQQTIRVVSGEIGTAADLVMTPSPLKEHIEVTGAVFGSATDTTELGTSVDQKVLTTLPTNGRNFVRFALVDPRVRNSAGLGGDGFAQNRLSVNGNTFRDTQWRLDGNTNYDTLFNNSPLQRLSLASIQEFRVLTNQFNAEHGSTSSGMVITTTKSGTDAFHGEAFFYARPSGIQARPPLANLRVPNQLLQEGGAVGGPLVSGKAYFFGSYERVDQERGSFYQGPTPGFFIGNFRDNLALAKFDFRLSDKHQISARANGQRDTNSNPNDRVGGLMQPGTANLFLGQSVAGQVTDTTIWGEVVNELRAGYTNAVPSSTVPLVPQIAVTRPGYATNGGSSFSTARTEVFQLADQVSWQRGSHTLKAGVDFIRRKVRDRQFDLYGAYTFAAGPPVEGVGPTLYTQRFGVADLTYGQTQWAAFIQDSWRAGSRLTLNLGLRYDYQSLLNDAANFGPRAGFAWDMRGTGSTILRGGYGLYYDQPFFHGLTQRFLLNAVDAPFATYSLGPGDPAFPLYPASYPPTQPPPGLTLAPRNVVIRNNTLLGPYTQQWTIGVQQRLPSDWTLTIDGIRSLSVKQFLHYNLNAPSPFARTAPGQMRTVAEADRTRPMYDPAAGVSFYQGVAVRDVRLATNGGTATFHALDVSVSKRYGRRYQVTAHYVYSSALNSITDDHLGANPQEWSDVQRGERGMSDFSQRNRFVGNGTVLLPGNINLAAFLVVASALPVNALTGVDNNGDTTNVDRPAGFGRNAFRGTPHRNLDVSLTRAFVLTEAFRLEVRADGLNVFNNQNYYSFNRVYGNLATPSAAFLSPIAGVSNTDPARQFVFGLKLLF